ncbi:hypothetical protein [Nostoc sp. PCC 7107]|uniref:hypothetical protein n=1 Tax=Nostoc sp. PCC 7107 TaxID=317936 RepID=UPI00029F42E9|nr:hypothetical protein [Nostoc sp. PCC 7107]AFY43657.1 hypothetical protein Nos7107_3066 [Nostoc sp. PCC 7107]
MQQVEPLPQPTIPQITTRETARLRSDYPAIEHLEAGNVAAWLMERQDQLLVRSKNQRAEMNLAKLLTLAVGATGAVCYATSPLAPIGALIAGVGYVWAVAQDLNDSHQFAPLPFIRGNFWEFAIAMGDSEARADWFSQKNELVDLMLHLEPFERYEFGMLKQYLPTLSEFLTTVESGKRFYAYRWLLDTFVLLRGEIPTQEQLSNHLCVVTVDPQIDYERVNLIQQRVTPLIGEAETVDHLSREELVISGTIENQQQKLLQFYDWDNLQDEAAGVLIVGNSGAAKTSVAVWLLGKFTESTPAQVLALDTHANVNVIWREWNIPVIREVAAIEAQIKLLVQLLNYRQELTWEQLETEDDIIVVADELNANLYRFKSPKELEIALKRLGSEGRKYKITFVALNQSSNCEDIGISRPMKNNYAIVLLGASAVSFAESNWKSTDPRRQHIESNAYPCIVSGAIRHQVALHPTHHQYTQFKKKGNAPQNLRPINTLPLTIPLAFGHEHLRQERQQPPRTSKTEDLTPEAQQRLQQIKTLIEQGHSPEDIINQLWAITPADGDRWEYVKGIYCDMCRILGIQPDDTPKDEVSTVDTKTDIAPLTVFTQELDNTSDSDNIPKIDTPDTYPDINAFPSEKELLAMLQNTNLPPGEFIKQTLKATRGDRYRLAIKAIVYVVRYYGDFNLMQKFQRYL